MAARHAILLRVASCTPSPANAAAAASVRGAARQTQVGLSLAMGVLGGWLALHIYGVFFYAPQRSGWMAAVPMVLAQTWLGVGLFIVSHDAIHGSLAIGRPGLNTAVGRLAAGLYNPGFRYGLLERNHHAHHCGPGSATDPDFHPERPRAYVAWFRRFFRTYFGWVELARLTVALCIYLFVLRARPLNLALFWGLPALLSALQLFTFGTWMPHRHAADAFADRHRARTLEFGWLLSLLTCFHFGYHLEHHRSPGTPWWGLPRRRAEMRSLAEPEPPVVEAA